MNLTFKDDKKLAISYFNNASDILLKMRFNIFYKKSDLERILENKTIFICAIDKDTDEVLGVLDATKPEKTNNKLISEICLITHIKGIGLKLFREFKTKYPDVETLGVVSTVNYISTKFSLRYFDYVCISNVLSMGTQHKVQNKFEYQPFMFLKHKELPNLNQLTAKLDRDELINLEASLTKMALNYLKYINNNVDVDSTLKKLNDGYSSEAEVFNRFILQY